MTNIKKIFHSTKNYFIFLKFVIILNKKFLTLIVPTVSIMKGLGIVWAGLNSLDQIRIYNLVKTKNPNDKIIRVSILPHLTFYSLNIKKFRKFSTKGTVKHKLSREFPHCSHSPSRSIEKWVLLPSLSFNHPVTSFPFLPQTNFLVLIGFSVVVTIVVSFVLWYKDNTFLIPAKFF